MRFQTHGNLQKNPHGQEDPCWKADREPAQKINEDRFQNQGYARRGITDEERSQDTADRPAGAN
jgi:hypothetical protein